MSSIEGEDSLPKTANLAHRLRIVLEQRGLNQTQAAERAGIPLATLNKWINQSDKAPNPSAENLARHIGGELKKRWHEAGVRLASVTVWETPESAARFLP